MIIIIIIILRKIRAIFEVQDDKLIILGIGKRRDIYKNLEV